MDFLDPKKKKAHRQRLFIGYILMFIAVALGALVMLFSAYGYDIDRKTGEIIQNGIVFVDSRPGGATVFVNNEAQRNRAATRLVMPAGAYTIRLELDGYRTWSRSMLLEGGRIEQLVYPLLIPVSLKPVDLQLYPSPPSEASTSPDRHWVLIQKPGQAGGFEQYDTSQPQAVPTTVQLPTNVLTEPNVPYTVAIVEWSNDNRHVILDRTYGGKHEFIMLDREQPTQSVNLTTTFNVPFTDIRLRDKKFDRFYLYDSNGGVVRTAELRNAVISGPILSSVSQFKTYGTDLVFYVTSQGAPAGKVSARIMRGENSYTLRQFVAGSTYLLDFSEYDGHFYYAAGASAEDTLYVYRDPVAALSAANPVTPSVATIVRLPNPQFVSFSANSRNIAVQSANRMVTYDIDGDRQSKFTIAQNIDIANRLKWMDDSRLAYQHENSVYMTDFEGSNTQLLGGITGPLSGPFFDRDYESMFTLGPSATVPSRTALEHTPLRVP
jgi:hypothetical protein